MNKKFYFVFCLICITIFILVSGCSSNGTKSVSLDTGSGKTKDKLTLDEIKQNYANTDEKILSIQEYKNYALVESQAPTIANRFNLYDLKTGDKDILPNGASFVDSAKIQDENHITLFAKGTDSESSRQIFPFEIDCTRGTENNNSDSDFVPAYKEIKFPIDKQIALKGKNKEEIKDIRVTVNGLQICFGPQRDSDAGFFADYLDSPTTDISYDKTSGELSFKFQDTIFAKSFSKTSSLSQYNTYVKSLNMKESENTAIITIKLNDTAKYYTGKKAGIEKFDKPNDVGFPFIDVQFFNSNMEF